MYSVALDELVASPGRFTQARTLPEHAVHVGVEDADRITPAPQRDLSNRPHVRADPNVHLRVLLRPDDHTDLVSKLGLAIRDHHLNVFADRLFLSAE